MGVFSDLGRLLRLSRQLPPPPSMAEAIRLSADAAELWAPFAQESAEAWAHGYGAASANPFDNAAFHAAGIPASGTVVRLTATDRSAAGQVVYAVDLEVRIDGQKPYRAVYHTLIATAALPNWRPGSVLPFRVDPGDPQALLLG